MAQAKVITEPETFKPITLQITLETQGEVNALYAVANTLSEVLFNAAKPGLENCTSEIESSVEEWESVSHSIYKILEPFTK